MGALAGILAATLVLGAAVGAVWLPWDAVPRVLLHQLGLGALPSAWKPSDEVILLQIRLPRVVAGVVVGAALAAAGVMYQGVLRNPLADPYVIGSSAGAALAATAAMAFLPATLAVGQFGLLAVAASGGALLAVLIVYRVAQVGRHVPTTNLLLAGFVLSALLNAGTALLLTLNAGLQTRLRQILVWLLGGIAVAGWQPVLVVGPLLVAGLLAAWWLARSLNAFALGEDGAAYVGVDVERQKALVVAVGALLTGLAVSLSGLVGFVGLVVPHLLRLVLGPDNRMLVPASALAGAGFVVAADALARTVLAPSELPVGIFTALLGAPLLLNLLHRSGREYRFS